MSFCISLQNFAALIGWPSHVRGRSLWLLSFAGDKTGMLRVQLYLLLGANLLDAGFAGLAVGHVCLLTTVMACQASTCDLRRAPPFAQRKSHLANTILQSSCTSSLAALLDFSARRPRRNSILLMMTTHQSTKHTIADNHHGNAESTAALFTPILNAPRMAGCMTDDERRYR